MEWYTLDDSLRRDEVIEGFKSFIWTERYSAWGDFQIVIKSSGAARSLLSVGTRIGMNESDRVMTIETVDDTSDADGVRELTVTGRSIEAWLDDRAAMPALVGTGTTEKWSLTGTPGGIARSMFSTICVSHVLDPGDTIPFYQAGTIFMPGTIAEPTEIITIEFEPGSLYAGIKQVCDIWALGFRLVKDGDTGKVYFDVYTGDNRTSEQTARPAVIFSQDMDNIGKTSSLRSNAAYKNVAYVFTKQDAMQVFADDVLPTITDAERRILVVRADDVDMTPGVALDALMIIKGRQALADNREVYALDGEIPQYQTFRYGVDYKLGDMVEERTIVGDSNYMIVTEQIFISDAEGERAYPTLSLSTFVSPGSWKSHIPTEHWADVGIDVHWADE